MDSEIARMFGKHLTSTVIDVCADFVGGFLLGSLVTWTAMREPLPMLEDGSGIHGKKVPFGNRMLVLARRTTREGIEITSIFAIVGIALWKTHNLMTNCLENGNLNESGCGSDFAQYSSIGNSNGNGFS